MYIPKHFTFNDREAVAAFMQQYSFATLVTVDDGGPVATHLPFIVELNGEEVILTSHFAKANPQSDAIAGKEALVIFMEPHAYISPSHYDKPQNVPTWNYIAVHAYGKVNLVTDETEQLDMMERMIDLYDKPFLSKWGDLPMDYKQKMLNGIVAFSIKVTDLQGKKKLSQNRSETERQNVIHHLMNSTDTVEKSLADFMLKEVNLQHYPGRRDLSPG